MTETERTVVKSYVPAYQKATWQREAGEMGMSQSEFVRAMVQAGRRNIALDTAESRSSGTNPGGQALEEGIRQLLHEEPRTWEALQAEFVDRLQEALEAMQSAGELRYDPSEGYVLDE